MSLPETFESVEDLQAGAYDQRSAGFGAGHGEGGPLQGTAAPRGRPVPLGAGNVDDAHGCGGHA